MVLFHIYDIQGGKGGHNQTRRSVNAKRRVGRVNGGGMEGKRDTKQHLWPEPFAYPGKHTCRASLGSLS